MTATLYQPQGTTVRRDRAGITITETGLLTGISSPPGRHARAALEASGLPRYGSTHPAWPNLLLVDIGLTAIDRRQWRVSLIYREPSPEDRLVLQPPGTVVDVEWYSSNVTVDRLYDANGNRLFHWYSGFPTSLDISGGGVREVRATTRQLGVKADRAEVQIPSVGVRVIMTETTDVRERRDFIGTLNSGYWSGDPPHTWLFVGVAGRKDKDRWINTYELIYRSDTWALLSTIEFNGAPPSDGVLGNGIARFQVYDAVNFGALGFSV